VVRIHSGVPVLCHLAASLPSQTPSRPFAQPGSCPRIVHFEPTTFFVARPEGQQIGDQRERWVGSGLLVAEKKFRRVQGYKQIPALIKELEAMTPSKPEVVKRRKAS